MTSEPSEGAATASALRTLLIEGRIAEAVAEISVSLKSAPDDPVLNKLMGVAQLHLGAAMAALPFLQKCVDLDPQNAEVHFNLATGYEAAGDVPRASAALLAALEIDPGYADAHNNIGLIFGRLGKLDDALRHLEAAVARNAESAIFHNNLATVQKQADRTEDAVGHFEQAIRLDPSFEQAYGNYGDLLQFQNRMEDVEAVLNSAAEHCDLRHPALLDLRAHLAIHKKNDAAARDFIVQAVAADSTDLLKHRRLSLLGKVNDRLADYDSAFENFVGANRFAAVSGRDRGIDGVRYAKRVDSLIANGEALAPPQPGAEAGDAPLVPTFLVGFPRSGTTLLDTILRSHPEIAVLEEQPVISQLRALQQAGPATQPAPLLRDDQRAALQARYFDIVADKFDREGIRVLVDKFPLNLVEAGFVRSVFPSAKFILALRHPNDCVLSCFMQTFDLNDAMANFLDLGDAARFYDRAMTLWRLYDRKLDLETHIIRYEDVVDDLRGAVAPLLEFLGVGWSDNVENYRATALGRDRINTPSYNQVTQPVYRRAMGRWQNYENRFEPIDHLLRPWRDHWGYD